MSHSGRGVNLQHSLEQGGFRHEILCCPKKYIYINTHREISGYRSTNRKSECTKHLHIRNLSTL
ncbi:hypothetical protein Hanom_Chr06g00574141 [Helianthus anomalus]